MRAKLWVVLAEMFPDQPEEKAFWESRFHFVTDKLTKVEGSVGSFVSDFIAYRNTAEPLTSVTEVWRMLLIRRVLQSVATRPGSDGWLV